MANPLTPKSRDGGTSFGLLLLRAVAGIALIQHGWPKVQNPMSWMEAFNIPDPAPGILQALAVLSEVGGGAALALGLLTPLAALGVLCTMGYAAWFHFGKGDPWIAKGGASYELALLYAMVALLLFLSGPGKASVDAMLFKKG